MDDHIWFDSEYSIYKIEYDKQVVNDNPVEHKPAIVFIYNSNIDGKWEWYLIYPGIYSRLDDRIARCGQSQVILRTDIPRRYQCVLTRHLRLVEREISYDSLDVKFNKINIDDLLRWLNCPSTGDDYLNEIVCMIQSSNNCDVKSDFKKFFKKYENIEKFRKAFMKLYSE